MFSKNLAISLALILFLTLGLAAGYLLGADKSSGSRPVIANKPVNNNPEFTVKTDLTAKEAYVMALPEARSWSPDAYLARIDLESKKFSASGLSNGWKITFYSKAEGKSYGILIKDGESRGGEEKAAEKSTQTLKGEMTDSALLAKSFFALYPVDTEIISLKMYYDAGVKKFLWTIFFPKGSHTIDAEI